MPHWLEMVVVLLQAPTADLRELARIAGADPKTFYRGIGLDGLDTVGQDLTGMEFAVLEDSPFAAKGREEKAKELTRRISNASRQEERVAIALDAIIQDPRGGIAALETYIDRAKFANYALEQIRAMLDDAPAGARTEEMVAAIVPKLFAYTYPLNRGRLLLFLAKHLARYPEVNEAIRRSLERTASMFVDEHRGSIREFLNSRGHEKRRHK